MRVGLLNPSPLGVNLTMWGDYQFGRSLEQALLRQGVAVEQRFWPEWDRLGAVDICLTLRGKRSQTPRPGQVNALWIISHPASVSAAEMEGYDVVFTASETHKARIAATLASPVHVLRQCTDTTLFLNARDPEDDFLARRDALFVANSRGIRRPIIGSLTAAGFPFGIIGRHWREVGLDALVRASFIENNQLPGIYANCRLALNDHWVDMKHFGFINNRIFDCLATGTPILTDSFPELREVCGGEILYCDDEASCREALNAYWFDYPSVLENVRDLWRRIGSEYTFDRRAEQILAAVRAPMPARRGPPLPETEPPLAAAISKSLSELRSTLGLEQLQVLHLFPRQALQHKLAGRADIDYITAGVGIGPWLVDLSHGLSAMPRGRFHCAIVEGGNADGVDVAELMAPGGEIFNVL